MLDDVLQGLKNKVAAAYSACASMGAEMPDVMNLENLPDTILSIGLESDNQDALRALMVMLGMEE